MISLLIRSALHMTSRARGAARFAGLLGLMGLVAACGGGGSTGSSSGGGGGGGGAGGGNNPPTATLSSIAVTPSGGSVAKGSTLQFTATGTYSDSTSKDITSTVTWASIDPSKATIAPATGLATGLAVGTTSITATSGTVVGTSALTVAPPTLVKVDLSPNKPSVSVHQVFKFRAIGTYSDNSTSDVTPQVTSWGSSNPAIVAVAADGTATAQSTLGTADISAAIAGGPGIDSVLLTVTSNIYAYATNYHSDTVSQYQIGNDGSLTPLATQTVATGNNPFSISVEPTGEYVYVSNWGSSTVSQFRIGADGTLTALRSRDVASGMGPNAVTIDHQNRFAYVANLVESTVSQYEIGLDGQLIPMATSKVATGSNPAIVIVDPADRFAYVGNFGANSNVPPAGPSTISQYLIGSDGALTPMQGAAATVVSGSGPNAITIDPTSHVLYVANLGDNNVGQYTINTDGTLSAMPTPTVPSGPNPAGIAINPTGQYVYVANQGDGSVSQYTVGSDGSLTPMTTPSVLTGGTGTSSVTVDPTGKYVYATNRGDTTISQFAINQTTGALTALTTGQVQAGTHPTAIATGY